MLIKKINVSNWLSIYRLMIAPYLILLVFKDERIVFATLLLISFITDILDGIIARKFNLRSNLGSQLDSAGDTVTFIVAMTGLLKFEEGFLLEQKNLLILSIMLYLFRLLFSVARYKKPSSFHTYLAKIAAVLQGVFFITVFYLGPINILFFITVIISMLVSVEEIILILMIPKWRSDVKGLFWILKNKKGEAIVKRNERNYFLSKKIIKSK